MSGFKLDKGKLRVDLVPIEAIESAARAMGYGGTKYPKRNWENGMEWMRMYAAILRHLFAWAKGEEKDESGLDHLDHVTACVMMLQTSVVRKIGIDDRPTVLEKKRMVKCVVCNGVGYHYGSCENA